ncbi:MAG: hypothetical protein ACREE9_03430 [Stellaceae bacterium]
MRFGYARVATDDRKLDLQQAALRAAGGSKICEDSITGKGLGLARPLKVRGDGDELMTHLTPTLSPRKRAEREPRWPAAPPSRGRTSARWRRGE